MLRRNECVNAVHQILLRRGYVQSDREDVSKEIVETVFRLTRGVDITPEPVNFIVGHDPHIVETGGIPLDNPQYTQVGDCVSVEMGGRPLYKPLADNKETIS